MGRTDSVFGYSGWGYFWSLGLGCGLGWGIAHLPVPNAAELGGLVALLVLAVVDIKLLAEVGDSLLARF